MPAGGGPSSGRVGGRPDRRQAPSPNRLAKEALDWLARVFGFGPSTRYVDDAGVVHEGHIMVGDDVNTLHEIQV